MNVLLWTCRRALRERGIWTSCLMLAICSLLLSGGVTRRNVLNLDIALVNVAYDTDFATMDEFRAWFDLWQFQWLMGAFGQICLFPVAAWMVPNTKVPEIKIPVSMGYHRAQVWAAALLRFCGQICVLSLMCVLLGGIVSGFHPAKGAGLLYYFRCIVLHVWRDIGFAGLALVFVLLPAKRSVGLCLSFGLMLGVSVLSASGVMSNTWLHVLLARMHDQAELWMWQITPQVPATEAVLLASFPPVSLGLASMVGLLRYRGDLQ